MSDGAPSIETQLALLVREVGELRNDHAELRALIEGPPWERSVRGRLHVLEGESATARVASETLAEVRRERRRATSERVQGQRTTRTFRWKAVGAATALAVALYPYLAHFAGWGG